jgi:PAS domain S-box-containing protein
MKNYRKLLIDNEEWLMHRILDYAAKFEFTKYTSTLAEAWRLSIQGLSNSLILASNHYSNEIPELHPDDQYVNDPISEFGIVEAQKHRERGVTLAMFLGLMKYYKESYIDLIDLFVTNKTKKQFYKSFTNRCFDRMEIAYCVEWTSHADGNLLEELQDLNRKMTNEKNKYLTIFESSYAPIILLDENLKISNLNQAAIELFTNFKIAGSIYYNEESSNTSFKYLNEQVLQFIENNPNETNFEINLATNKGELLFQVSLKKMQDVSKKFMGTVIMLDDITERRKAELNIKESQEKLKALNTDKDRFISILAHDLRNPFNSLLGFSELLVNNLKNTPVDKVENHLKIMNDTINRTFNLLEDLLLWSKAQSGKITVQPTRINLKEICSDVVNNMKNQAALKEIEINNTIKEEYFSRADYNLTKTVLRNLISNAIKFTNKNGQIKISAENNGSNVSIIVSDNGVGINAEDQLKLWDFTKSFSTTGTNNESGTGFGLLVCKELIEKQDGKIWVESEQGKGSRFIFSLPSYIEN